MHSRGSVSGNDVLVVTVGIKGLALERSVKSTIPVSRKVAVRRQGIAIAGKPLACLN
jgi:hypothetical protein